MTADYAALAAGATTPSAAQQDSPPEFKFINPGDEVFGVVTRVQLNISTKFGDNSVIELTDHRFGPITVWLSNVQLRSAFVEGNNPVGRPVAVGDTIFARFDSLQPLEGGKTVKNFSINLQPGTGQVPAQPAPAAPIQQVTPTTYPHQQAAPAVAPQPVPGGGGAGQPVAQAPQPAVQVPQQVAPQPQQAPGGLPF